MILEEGLKDIRGRKMRSFSAYDRPISSELYVPVNRDREVRIILGLLPALCTTDGTFSYDRRYRCSFTE